MDRLLEYAVRWLEQPIEIQQADMPMFTESELQEMRSWLPKYRRALMLGW